MLLICVQYSLTLFIPPPAYPPTYISVRKYSSQRTRNGHSFYTVQKNLVDQKVNQSIHQTEYCAINVS